MFYFYQGVVGVLISVVSFLVFVEFISLVWISTQGKQLSKHEVVAATKGQRLGRLINKNVSFMTNKNK